MESPRSAQEDGFPIEKETEINCEKSSSATLYLGDQFLCVGEDGVVAPETGAAANLGRLKRLGNHNLLLGKQGLPRKSTYPAMGAFAGYVTLHILR